VVSEEMPTVEPETWELSANGQAIPEIEDAADLTNHWLWVRQELKTTDPELTPRLHSLTENVTQSDLVPVETEGYRVSSELDISGTGNVKDSQIFWKAHTRSESTIIVETRFYNGQTWTDWQAAANGREVPGLIKGTELESAKLQTRAVLAGGPETYPVLQSINIFIEVDK